LQLLVTLNSALKSKVDLAKVERVRKNLTANDFHFNCIATKNIFKLKKNAIAEHISS